MTHKNTILSCWIYFSISKKEEIDPETSSEWQRKRKDPETILKQVQHGDLGWHTKTLFCHAEFISASQRKKK